MLPRPACGNPCVAAPAVLEWLNGAVPVDNDERGGGRDVVAGFNDELDEGSGANMVVFDESDGVMGGPETTWGHAEKGR